MTRIADALELLTAQHDEIDALLAEVSTAANADVRAHALDDLADKLTLHLAAEQQLLYPRLRGTVSDEVLAELAVEHAEIKRVLAEVVWLEPDDEQFARKLTDLKALLLTHSVWQERDLFETVAEDRAADELSELGARIQTWLDDAMPAVATAA